MRVAYFVAVLIFSLISSLMLIMFDPGHVASPEVREPHCINSACDTPCVANSRFVRHQGCIK